ncbi:hypothetical protein CMUS01_12628 [Colletotrichum musicola]|uniref:Uncharacterized protein n=1 Tax=Colletotrichum musicola TaxID=2175873 RepID=A0A8H6JKZ6_9PEZI|nr:hypothetical protein CMUS01_12628 [Colletotrichum musicola]
MSSQRRSNPATAGRIRRSPTRFQAFPFQFYFNFTSTTHKPSTSPGNEGEHHGLMVLAARPTARIPYVASHVNLRRILLQDTFLSVRAFFMEHRLADRSTRPASERPNPPSEVVQPSLQLRKAVRLGLEKTSSDFWSSGNSVNPITIELQNITIETVSEGPGIGFERLEALSKKSRLLARRLETSKRRPRSLSRAAFEPAEMT